jgi:hypothetical protein
MDYIIKSDEPWIQCTCKGDTPNANLHNIQRTQWQTEPDLAAAPASILEIPKAAVAAMIKTPVAGPRAAAAAAAMIKTPARDSLQWKCPPAISNNPSFRLKYPGVPDGADGSDGTSYPPTENYMLPIAQAMGCIA